MPDVTRKPSPTAGLRPDIQGLRALAVLLVLVYHLRPNRVPGGFLGVDVFFVISGYLIMGSLARSTVAGRLNLPDFYAKRARRLLPAATVTLLAVAVWTMVTNVPGAWPRTLRHVVGSALQVQNWVLAAETGDYAEATADASPLQHFWSLAVEEQFYILTPLMFLALAWWARRRGHRVSWRGVTVLVWLVTISSLVFSIAYTPVDPGAAYYITPTRMWQLGVGGLISILEPRWLLTRRVRLVLGWAGLAIVLVCALTYTTMLAFPGWVALVPTSAAAMLILAGRPDVAPDRGQVSWWLGRQPWHYLGDISYSLYLVHWPLIVFAMAASPTGRISTWGAPVVVLSALVLAGLSKVLVEDPFRRRRLPRAKVLLAGVAMVSTSALVGGAGWAYGHVKLEETIKGGYVDAQHRGYAATGGRIETSRPDPGVAPVPPPEVALQDVSDGFRQGCDGYDLAKHPASDSHCTYGDPKAPNLVVLVGDSHAGQYSTVLIDLVRRRPDWRLKIIDHNGCPFSAEPPADKGVAFENCRAHNRGALDAILTLRPQVVVTSAMSPRSYAEDLRWTWPSYDRQVAGYRSVLDRLVRSGVRVAAVGELPRTAQRVPACVKANPDHVERCDTPRSVAFQPHDRPLAEAARGVTGVTVIDPATVLCSATSCPAVVGNVLVYRDNHLSDTYVRTISRWLEAQLPL